MYFPLSDHIMSDHFLLPLVLFSSPSSVNCLCPSLPASTFGFKFLTSNFQLQWDSFVLNTVIIKVVILECRLFYDFYSVYPGEAESCSVKR